METPTVTIKTHDGPFHGDDVFATATLIELVERGGGTVSIIRSRDPEIEADFWIDVGLEYDPENGRFDHHQDVGAGCRDYGTYEPYASFGLIWKEFGSALCGSDRAAAMVDKLLVRHVDAVDCGLATGAGYSISSAISSFNPTWNDDQAEARRNQAFRNACEFARTLLRQEIGRAKSMISSIHRVRKQAAESQKRGLPNEIMLLETFVPWRGVVINEFPGVSFVVFPNTTGSWVAHAVPISKGAFKSKKLLPEAWGGLSGSNLDIQTQVPGGIFCHRNRYMAIHNSQEGAIAMAAIAVATESH